jgi:hypothetical protein
MLQSNTRVHLTTQRKRSHHARRMVLGSRDEEYLGTDGRMILACKLIATFAISHLERYN